MNDDHELIPRKAGDIPEWELEVMIEDAIRQVLRAGIADRP
jgi:hypothetical protein